MCVASRHTDQCQRQHDFRVRSLARGTCAAIAFSFPALSDVVLKHLRWPELGVQGLQASSKPRESERSCRQNCALRRFLSLLSQGAAFRLLKLQGNRKATSSRRVATQSSHDLTFAFQGSRTQGPPSHKSVLQDRRKALLSSLTDQLKQVLARTWATRFLGPLVTP